MLQDRETMCFEGRLSGVTRVSGFTAPKTCDVRCKLFAKMPQAFWSINGFKGCKNRSIL